MARKILCMPDGTPAPTTPSRVKRFGDSARQTAHNVKAEVGYHASGAVEGARKQLRVAGAKVQGAQWTNLGTYDNLTSFKKGSEKELQEIRNMQLEIAHVDQDFVRYVATEARLDKKGRGLDSQQDAMNELFDQQMFMACLAPLERGVDASSVAQAIGMRTAMCLLCPEFRDKYGTSHMLDRAFMPLIEQKAEEKGPGSYWAKKRDKILKHENGGRIPLTPRSAAMMEIGFDRRAFDELRSIRPDPSLSDEEQAKYVTDKQCQIIDNLAQAKKVLHEQAAKDGISEDVLNQTKRLAVTKLISVEPTYSQLYKELSNNEVSRASGVLVGDRTARWSGEYVSVDGTEYTGGFTVRPPFTAMEHYNAQKAWFTDMYSKCDSLSDIEMLYGVVPEGSSKQAKTMASQCYTRMSEQTAHFETMMMADGVIPVQPINVNGIHTWTKSMAYAERTAMADWLKSHPECMKEWAARQAAGEQVCGLDYHPNQIDGRQTLYEVMTGRRLQDDQPVHTPPTGPKRTGQTSKNRPLPRMIEAQSYGQELQYGGW